MREFLKLFRSPEVKASRTARHVAFESGGRARSCGGVEVDS